MMDEFFCTWCTRLVNSEMALLAMLTKSGMPREFQLSGLNPWSSTFSSRARRFASSRRSTPEHMEMALW